MEGAEARAPAECRVDRTGLVVLPCVGPFSKAKLDQNLQANPEGVEECKGRGVCSEW